MGKYKIQKRRTSTKYRKGQVQDTEKTDKHKIQEKDEYKIQKRRVGDNLLLDYWNLLLDVNLKRRVKL